MIRLYQYRKMLNNNMFEQAHRHNTAFFLLSFLRLYWMVHIQLYCYKPDTVYCRPYAHHNRDIPVRQYVYMRSFWHTLPAPLKLPRQNLSASLMGQLFLDTLPKLLDLLKRRHYPEQKPQFLLYTMDFPVSGSSSKFEFDLLDFLV